MICRSDRSVAQFSLLGFCLLFIFSSATTAYSDTASDAQRLLATRCVTCHGPDRQRSGLRLDLREYALLGGDSNTPAVIAGDAHNSLLIRKVSAENPDERMPAEGDRLSPIEIEVLRAWIDAGAPWPPKPLKVPDGSDHWSFIAPERPPIPTGIDADTNRNPIDAFLLAKLESQRVAPSPEADRYTLIRRAHLELTGLPPTPDEVATFIADSSADSYEKVVDRLFASPHYGERQARQWLDAARYADTNGYEKDRPRSIWPYRDWVIDAFNANMPFDQFVIEQLAGDLLPDATESQRIATGFHRNTMLNEEGGIDAGEDRYKRTIDRTNTTGTVFLGLTIGCAQCHAHKYDPITQREYYSLFAIFDDAQEATLLLFDETVASERAAAQEQLKKQEEWIIWAGAQNRNLQAEYQSWREETAAKCVAWREIRPVSMKSENGATLSVLEDASVLVSGDIPNDDVYILEFDVGEGPITGLRLEALPHPSLPAGGPGRGTILTEGDFLLTGLEASLVSRDGIGSEAIPVAAASHDYAAKDRHAKQALDGKGDTGWSIKGAIGKPHQAVFEFEAPVDAQGKRLRLVLTQDYIHQHTLGRFRISVTSQQTPLKAAGVPAALETALLESSARPSEGTELLVKRYYLLEVAPALKKSHERRDRLRESSPSFPTTLVMSRRTPPRETRRYRRGEYGSPGRKVEPGVPGMLPPLPPGATADRLGLAQWIVDTRNPLTARVAMNRMWQQVFGRGLVNTPEDFGTRGDAPTHPELLDWLAVEFMDRDWDLKAMHRLMVTTAAFRRSSSATPVQLTADPENTLLARGPRYRLDAEIIRDVALSAGGLLNTKIGGPSVYPPQPDGVTELAYGKPGWPTSSGPDRYRRGLYTYAKRTAPYSSAATLDAPSADEACVQRRRTNTPLQALTLLNDRVYIEAAQAMARRVLRHESDTQDKIDFAYLLAVARPPDSFESERITEFYDQSLLRFRRETGRAWAVSGPIGLFEADRIAELAAWTTVCRAMLNLDEMVMQR